MFPITFTPTAPANFGGKTFRTLSFKRPISLLDVLRCEGTQDTILRMSTLYASLAGVPVGAILAMSIEDQSRLAEAVSPILALEPAGAA